MITDAESLSKHPALTADGVGIDMKSKSLRFLDVSCCHLMPTAS